MAELQPAAKPSAKAGMGLEAQTAQAATPSVSAHHLHPNWLERKICDLIYYHTCKCLCGTLLVLLILSGIVTGGGLMSFSEPSNFDWTVTADPTSVNHDALNDAARRVDPTSATSVSVTPPRTVAAPLATLLFVYTHQEDSTSDIFTPANLKEACELENLMLDHKDYPNFCVIDGGGNCTAQDSSVLRFFYPPTSVYQRHESWGLAGRHCELLTQVQVSAGWKDLWAGLNDNATSLRFGFHVSKDTLSSGHSVAARSQLNLGGPLTGYNSIDDNQDAQLKLYRQFHLDVEEALFARFGMVYQFFRTAYVDPANTDHMRVRFWSQLASMEEMTRMVNGDLTFTLLSMVFVFVYIWVHTGSLWLTATAMLQIMLSLPVAFFIYRVVFQITFYTQLHILVIFLVLGVGADDVFVFVDGWKQSRNVSRDPYTRLVFSFKRAVRAVFNTSFTTAFAFCATAVSPIMPVSSFGIYAALSIVLNYLFVITVTPCAVLVWHRRWSKAAKHDRETELRRLANGEAMALGSKEVPMEAWSESGAETSDGAGLEPETGSDVEGAPAVATDASSVASAPNDSGTGAGGSSEASSSVPLTDAALVATPHDTTALRDLHAEDTDGSGTTGDDEEATSARGLAAYDMAGEDETDRPSTPETVTLEDKVHGVAEGVPACQHEEETKADGAALGSGDEAEAAAPVIDQVELQVAPPSHAPPLTDTVSLTDRFFRDYYSAAMLKEVKGVKVVSWAFIIAFVVYFGFSFYWSSLLQTPQREEQWFQAQHMHTGLNDLMTSTFMAATTSQYSEVRIAWGIAGIDRSDYVAWEPSKNRGDVIFDDSFDLTTKAAQDHILSTCDRLRTFQCNALGCISGTEPRTLALEQRVDCFLENYKAWYMTTSGQGTLPTGDEFLTSIKAFRALNPQFGSAIGIIDGKLKYVSITFISSLIREQPNGVTKPVFEEVNRFIDETNAAAPPTARGAIHDSLWWMWMRTEDGLVSGMFVGLGLSSVVALFVLCAATDNIYLALYAVACIAGIVASVLGFGQHFLGWALGAAESISAVIVIGFSVDYVVHLGHMYAEAPAKDRATRMRHAATTMGSTVVAGAVTTFGAGAVMLLCQMVFFTKMATLISLTILFSFGTAMGGFMALCAVIGPEGDSGRISLMFARAKAALGLSTPPASPATAKPITKPT